MPPEVPEAFRRRRSASAARSCTRRGRSCSPTIEKKYPELAGGVEDDAGARAARRAGTSDLPTFPADAKGRWPRASPAARCSTQFAKKIPWLLGGSADLAPSTKTLLTFDEAGGDLSADNPGGRNLHFGIREHGMAAAVNGMVLCGLRALRRDVLRVHRLLPAVDAAGGDHEDSQRSSCSRTIRSASAKTARRISRSSTWPPAGRFRICSCCGPATRTKRRRLESDRCSRTTRPVAIVLTRQNLPTLDRTKYAPADGVAQRRLHAGRRARAASRT